MPRAEQSIVIHHDPDQVFAITNDIARWPELFKEYRHARVLTTHRSGWFARLDFELTDTTGKTWRSWCILDYKARIAITQHALPTSPFRSIHFSWHYQPVENGVRMTWIQDFEIPPDAAISDAQALASVLDTMTSAQQHCKEVLESLSCYT
ncbi:MAG TPA: SRPBCC family protein [Ktedonobacteraceae bacterium]|nr:SRPBCC family protein [Ktedonobacteraceae bacterium]